MEQELEDYLLAHSDPQPSELELLNRTVNLELLYPRMCSGHLQGRVLTMLTAMIAPKRALEIGTYAGYSALCIAEGLPEGGTLDTVEIDDEMEGFIRRQLAKSPWGKRVKLHIGDISQIGGTLDGPYEMVYMDADKRTYWETFCQIRQLVLPGGFVLADNTLWDGKVVEANRYPDPQTQGIANFNDRIARPYIE